VITRPVQAVRRASHRADWESASTLLREYAEWIKAATAIDPFVEQPSFTDEILDPAGHYSNDDLVLFVAFVGAQAVGTLAVASRPGGGAELKRMYVRPTARGHGVADALLAEAIALADRRRCNDIWLESVHGAMDAAIAVYRRNGFTIVDMPPTISVDGAVVMRRGEPVRAAAAGWA